MRFLFLIAILFVTSCSAQHKPEQQSKVDTSKIDTTKIFNPKPNPNDDLTLENLSKLNTVYIQDDFNVFLLNEQEYKIPYRDTLKNFLNKHFAEISQSRFFIVYDGSEDEFPRIVSVINSLRESNIDNYRVINIQNYLNQVATTTFSEPEIVTVDHDESSDVKIGIGQKNYKLLLSNQTEVFTDTLDIDKFIKKNKESIATKKIILISEKNIPFNRVKPIINILKKHNLKFEMTTK